MRKLKRDKSLHRLCEDATAVHLMTPANDQSDFCLSQFDSRFNFIFISFNFINNKHEMFSGNLSDTV